MKKTLLTAIICAFTATTAVLAQQHQQTMSFTGPTQWVPGTTVSLDVFLTINYNAYALSYWLEVQNPLAPYLAITNILPPPNPPPPYPILFNIGGGNGYMGESYGLGAASGPPGIIPPGTNYVNTITFSLAAGAPIGSYTLRTTSELPRTSEVTDTDFNDNNINPPGMFVINVVPEPSTLALVGFAVMMIALRRRPRL